MNAFFAMTGILALLGSIILARLIMRSDSVKSYACNAKRSDSAA